MSPDVETIDRAARRRFRQDETGATAVLAALTAPLLLAMTGLAAEGAMAYFKHAKMQSVSDAAAYSAAAAFQAGANAAQARLEAIAVAASMGYATGGEGALTVTVNSPPTSGPNTGNATAAEVILAYAQEPLLTRVFRTASYTISTRSVSIVATSGSPACVMALSPSNSDALHLGGNAKVTLNNCDVVVNSSSDSAATANGNVKLSAAHLAIVGGTTSNGSGQPFPTTVQIPANSVSDPYAGLPIPSVSPCAFGPAKNNKQNTPTSTSPIPPGVYCGGLELKNGSYTMNGLYVMYGGDFSAQANAVVVGTNVTIITVPAGGVASNIDFQANSNVKLVAPTSGTYAGVALYATGGTASSPQSVDWAGNAKLDVTGAIYMPHTNLTLRGGVSDQSSSCTQIIAWKLDFQGTPSLNANCSGVGTRAFGANSTTRSALAD